MGFGEAVKTCFDKYATFEGRARRSEYWFFTLFLVVASIVAAILDAVIGAPVTQALLFLGTIVPGIAVAVRRLHDTDRSGWLYLIAFVPLVGFILLIVWFCQDSKPAPNQWGPSPKHGDGGFTSQGGTPGYGAQGYEQQQPGV